MGRPNRGTGSAGIKKPGNSDNGGGKDQYSLGGSSSSSSKGSKSTKKWCYDGVKCKLPDTATIPYSPVVGIPSCVAAQYGLGLGLGFGFPGAWG